MEAYRSLGSLKATAIQFGMSDNTVRRMLHIAGELKSPTYDSMKRLQEAISEETIGEEIAAEELALEEAAGFEDIRKEATGDEKGIASRKESGEEGAGRDTGVTEESSKKAKSPGKYEGSTCFTYHLNKDIEMKYRISTDAKRGHRINVSLVKPDFRGIEPKVGIKDVCHYGKKGDLIRKAEKEYADELYKRIPKEMLITEGKYSGDLTLATILAVHRDDLAGVIERGYEAAEIQDTLFKILSDKSADNVTLDDCLLAIGAYVDGKNFKGDEKDKYYNRCCQILKDSLNYCNSGALIISNPMEAFKRRRDLIGIIKGKMSVGALTRKQDEALYRMYSTDITNPYNIGTAFLHQNGLLATEICGLKFGDIYAVGELTGHKPVRPLGDLEENGIYVLSIERSYRKTGVGYKLSQVIKGIDSYRFLPLNRCCTRLLVRYYRFFRDKYGYDDEKLAKLPIVCSRNTILEAVPEEHCKPDTLRLYARECLAKTGVEPRTLYIPPVKGAAADFLLMLDATIKLFRRNAESKMKNVCGLSMDETNYLLGRKPKSVDARYYREFRELYNQLGMRIKMDRWCLEDNELAREPGVLTSGAIEENSSLGTKHFMIMPSHTSQRAQATIRITGQPGKKINLVLGGRLGMSGTITVNG